MKVVVTGGAGFLGSHTVEALLGLDFQVEVVDNLSAGSEKNLETAGAISKTRKIALGLHKASILDCELDKILKDAKAVIHLATTGSFASSIENPAHDFSENFLSSEKLLSSALKQGVNIFLNITSAEAYYGKSSTVPFDERSSCQPMSPYAGSKVAFENYLTGLVRGLKESGKLSSLPAGENYFTYTTLRMSQLLGPRQSKFSEAPLVSQCIEALSRGLQPSLFGEGNRSRDYVDVRDAAKAICLALTKSFQIPIDDAFNVSSGIETKDIEVFEAIKTQIKNLSLEEDDNSKVNAALKVLDPKFMALRSYEAQRSFYVPTRAEAFLNWKPQTKFHDLVSEIVKEFFCAKKT